jgi:CDGSH-type Zn-finger protein
LADDVVITPIKNGPLYVQGTVRLQRPDGEIVESEGETWLCRCGGSSDKPFCDGTHKTNGFKSGEPRKPRTENPA